MTIRSFFEENLTRNPDRTLFLYKQKGEVVKESYVDASKRVRAISEFLIKKLKVSERTNPVSIILENGALWMELYLGCNSVAVPVVPIDPKLKPEEISYIIGDSSAEVIFTDCHHIKDLTEIAPSLKSVKAFVFSDGCSHEFPECIDSRPCYNLQALIDEAMDAGNSECAAIDSIAPCEDDVASIIYTSGTTGHPKGALVTNKNFCFDADAAISMFREIDLCSNDDFFVVLPLFHSFSFNTNFIVPMRVGAGIQIASSLRTIGDEMKLFKPSIFMAVPLLVEKIHGKIADGIRKNRIAKILCGIGLKRLLIPRIRSNFGSRVRLIIVGGAPCSPKLLKAMATLGMPIIEGYGLTEASPIVSIRPYSDNHVGTIGIPIPGIEVKLFNQGQGGVGELCVRGPIVMKGYLNKPEATREALDEDGWLHTGDLASQDKDGFLTICGRKKSLIVNREGKNIYPEEVEICISRDKRVLDVIVIGYTEGDEVGEKVGAIVVPNIDFIKEEKGGNLPDWAVIEKEMHTIVSKRCAHLAEYKTPRKVVVYKDPLERTSSGKIRRFTYQGALNV